MGLKDLFSKKKSKKELRSEKLNDAFNRVYSQIGQMDSWEDPKKLERYILDSCEQIIASTKKMERQKTEYRIVTAYLNDIKTIEELPADEAQELKTTAARINELELSIKTAKNVKRNISDEQFQVISQDEDTMPDIIKTMADDEKYQSKYKKNINFLEGEKSRWEIERENLADEKNLLKRVATIILTSFMALLMLLFVGMQATETDLTVPFLIVFIICAFAGFGIFLRQNEIKKQSHSALVRMNQSVRMLNVERIKYVNITNSIEFQKDKYKVETAAQLQYVWEQYMEKIRDQERYIKNNEDLEFYVSRLERILSKLVLHDPEIWANQTSALVNHDDMVEVRHRLVVRRQKIRARLEDNQAMIQNERDEIDRLMMEHEHYLPEIKDIIASVDKLCGTKSSGAALKNKKKPLAV